MLLLLIYLPNNPFHMHIKVTIKLATPASGLNSDYFSGRARIFIREETRLTSGDTRQYRMTKAPSSLRRRNLKSEVSL